MEDIINLFDAETVWKCINNEKGIEVGKREEYYLNCAKKFGMLCSITSDKTNNQEFIDAYNEISKEIIRRIDTKEKISLPEIGDSISKEGKLNNCIKAICYGEKNGIKQDIIDNENKEEYLNEIEKVWIICNYGACLNALKNAYGSDILYNFFEKRKEKQI